MPVFLIPFNLASHYNHVTEYTSPCIKAFCWPCLRCLLEYALDYKALVVGMTRMCNNGMEQMIKKFQTYFSDYQIWYVVSPSRMAKETRWHDQPKTKPVNWVITSITLVNEIAIE